VLGGGGYNFQMVIWFYCSHIPRQKPLCCLTVFKQFVVVVDV
jgi:hypothetical protein